MLGATCRWRRSLGVQEHLNNVIIILFNFSAQQELLIQRILQLTNIALPQRAVESFHPWHVAIFKSAWERRGKDRKVVGRKISASINHVCQQFFVKAIVEKIKTMLSCKKGFQSHFSVDLMKKCSCAPDQTALIMLTSSAALIVSNLQ